MKTNIANIKIFPTGMVEVPHIALKNASRSIIHKYSFVKFM